MLYLTHFKHFNIMNIQTLFEVFLLNNHEDINEVNQFVNSGIVPTSIASEYLEEQNKLLITIGYNEKSTINNVWEKITEATKYLLKNVYLGNTDAVDVYLKKALQDQCNNSSNICHTIYVLKNHEIRGILLEKEV